MTYLVAMRKLATSVVQDFAARQHVDNTRQLASRMPKMRPTIMRMPKPTVAKPMASALQSSSSRLGQAIKGAIK